MKDIWVAFRDLGYKLVYIKILSDNGIEIEFERVYDYMKTDPDYFGWCTYIARSTRDFTTTYTLVDPIEVLTTAEIRDIYGVDV